VTRFVCFDVDLVFEEALEQVRHVIAIHGRFNRVSIKGILVRYLSISRPACDSEYFIGLYCR
jgi:hypothetical protein